MELDRRLLKEAVAKGLIDAPQAERLWAFLAERGRDTPSFRPAHILYYLGGWGLRGIALGYGMAGLWLTEYLLRRGNLAMIAVGATLSRRVFAVFGGLGAAGYVGHLAYGVFKDSMLFPFALTVIGFGVVYLGILWQRHEATLSTRLRSLLPPALRELIGNRH
jgi:hypothetical protein